MRPTHLAIAMILLVLITGSVFCADVPDSETSPRDSCIFPWLEMGYDSKIFYLTDAEKDQAFACAEKGYPGAMYVAGAITSKNSGTDQYFWSINKVGKDDARTAIQWFQKAVAKGDKRSYLRLGTLLVVYGDGTEEKMAGWDYLWKAVQDPWKDIDAKMAARKLLLGYFENDKARVWLTDWMLKNDLQGLSTYFHEMFFESHPTTGWNVAEAASIFEQMPPDERPFDETYRRIFDQRAACLDASTTKLFGEKINCLYRGDVISLLTARGLTPIRVDPNYFYDIFEGKNFHREASKISVGYAPIGQTLKDLPKNNRFARMLIEFPSSLDVAHVERVRAFVEYSYGQPNTCRGSSQVGNYTCTWTLEDNVSIQVRRENWPSTAVDLTIEHADAAAQLDTAIQKQEEEVKNRQREESPLG